MKRCSMSLIIKEIKLKTTGYSAIHFQVWIKIKQFDKIMCYIEETLKKQSEESFRV